MTLLFIVKRINIPYLGIIHISIIHVSCRKNVERHYVRITKTNVSNIRQITGQRNENVPKTPRDVNLDFRTTP
jgi:hypothetical protein